MIVGEVFESVGVDDDSVDWGIDEVVGMVWLDISEPGSVKLRPEGALSYQRLP